MSGEIRKSTPVLLAVFAHPDDESYGPGGTLAKLAGEGVKVHLLTFTCGEAGTIGISRELGAEELCRRRTGELAAACDALGFAGHRVLGYPDRRIDRMPEEEGIEAIAAEIRRLRPEVLVTFDHRGVSAHPDHIAVTRMTRAAFARTAGEGPVRLFEWALPRRRLPLYGERRVAAAEDDEITHIVSIPDSAMERKLEAIARHETQIDFYHELERLFGDYRKATSKEYFILVEDRGDGRGVDGTDLFAGLGAIK